MGIFAKDVPTWMYVMFSPVILIILVWFFMLLTWTWKSVCSHATLRPEKKDMWRSIWRSFRTAALANLLSCAFVLIAEIVDGMSSNVLRSLTLWDNAITAIIYVLPLIVSIIVIFLKNRALGFEMTDRRAYVRMAAIVSTLFCSPWYLIIPTVAWRLVEAI
ncbi:MAG: hypothetical protein E7315_00855 [Clostridiales bacterium]|nr:hypothetical protein [Clostridiales bacterium]